jgi:D-arginine dehydrogenase
MTHDFIIVGAGMAGASLAYELAATGKLCLVEGEDRPGFHATGRSAALFAPSYGGSAIRAITRASRGFFNTPPADFVNGPLLIDRACLYIAREDQIGALHELTDEVCASGGVMTPLSAAEACALIPLLRENYVAEAAIDLDAADIDVDALHQGYLRGAKARGAELVTSDWVRKASFESDLWTVELKDRMISAPILINAAGAWADELARLAGVAPRGLQPLRRTALLVDPPTDADIRLWPAVLDPTEEFYFKPDAGKLLLSPADETPVAAGDAQPEELDIAIAIDRVQQAIDIEVRRVSHSWAGLRTFAPDRVPVVGYDSACPGFFWYAGQGGYGIQTAPAMSRLAAALVRKEAVPADIAARGVTAAELSPDRLPIWAEAAGAGRASSSEMLAHGVDGPS